MLANWITVGILVPVLIGIGVGVMSMSPPDLVIAKFCFTLAALILLSRVAWWLGLQRPPNTGSREAILFAFVIIGGIAAVWVASLNWVDGRRAKPPGVSGMPYLHLVLILDSTTDQNTAFHFEAETDQPIDDIRAEIVTSHAAQKEFSPPFSRSLLPGDKLSIYPGPFMVKPHEYNRVNVNLTFNAIGQHARRLSSAFEFFFEADGPKSINPSGITPTERVGLPGMSLQMQIMIHNLEASRRKYLFDFGHLDKGQLSVYISPDNIFTVSFVDGQGEPHLLQLPTGRKGVPLDEPFYLGCEVGVGESSTILRVLVDGSELRSLALPFRIDVGSLDVPGGVVGADLNGKNGASFDLTELAVYSVTLRDSDVLKMKEYFASRPRTPFVEFSGSQWMRVNQAGRHDLNQPDKSHAPIFRKPKER